MSISRDVRNLARAPRISATIIDVVGKRCSVKISNSARTLKNIPFYGSVPSVGDIVDIDYSSGKPSAYVTQGISSSDTNSDLRTTRDTPLEEDVYPETEEYPNELKPLPYTWVVNSPTAYSYIPGAYIPSTCYLSSVAGYTVGGSTAQINIVEKTISTGFIRYSWFSHASIDNLGSEVSGGSIGEIDFQAERWLQLYIGSLSPGVTTVVVSVTFTESPAAQT